MNANSPRADRGAIPVAPDHPDISDASWAAIVADYRAKRAEYHRLVTALDEAESRFEAHVELTAPKPKQPESVELPDIKNMTIAQIRAVDDTPENKAAWQQYEQDLAAWTAMRDGLHDTMVGPIECEHDRSLEEHVDAFRALVSYPVSSLTELDEKMALVLGEYEGFDVAPERVAAIQADVRRLNAVAAPNAGDPVIEAAWQRRQEAFAVYNALPDDDGPSTGGYAPGEREQWDIIDAAEETIQTTTANTIRGAMIQLQVGLYHATTSKADESAITRGDFQALRRDDSNLDWPGQMMLAALISLASMVGHKPVDQPTAFNANDWIAKATEAGATFFVRDDELWIGAVTGSASSEVVEQLRAELDDERRQLVRDALAARGLLCVEA